MNKRDFEQWQERMKLDYHGGQIKIAELLDVSPSMVRRYQIGRNPDGSEVKYSRVLDLACAALLMGLKPFSEQAGPFLPQVLTDEGESSLIDWHKSICTEYLVAVNKANPQWPVSMTRNHYQFSYRITEKGGDTHLDCNALRQALDEANERVRSEVWTGWSMFHEFTRVEIKPRVVIDNYESKEVEALQASLLNEQYRETTVPDYWRVTVDGRATIIRPYREDRREVPHLVRAGILPGGWIAPGILVREVFELVIHARELAKAFRHAFEVQFVCSWNGLKGRRIADSHPGVDWNDGVSFIEERTTQKVTTIVQLAESPSSIVAELAGPVARLFDGLKIDTRFIEDQRPQFRTL
jgi:hypothetical protein